MGGFSLNAQINFVNFNHFISVIVRWIQSKKYSPLSSFLNLFLGQSNNKGRTFSRRTFFCDCATVTFNYFFCKQKVPFLCLLICWMEKIGEDGGKNYWEQKNQISIDGKPTQIISEFCLNKECQQREDNFLLNSHSVGEDASSHTGFGCEVGP